MKKISLLIAFLFSALFALPQSKVDPDAIVGLWISNLEKSHVDVSKENDKYQGEIIWLKAPTYPDGTAKLDKKNPDKLKQTQPLIGLIFLKDLVFVKDHWENGNIYDPESGKTYSCRATLKDENTLELRGYLGVSQIGRTQTWVRLKK